MSQTLLYTVTLENAQGDVVPFDTVYCSKAGAEAAIQADADANGQPVDDIDGERQAELGYWLITAGNGDDVYHVRAVTME